MHLSFRQKRELKWQSAKNLRDELSRKQKEEQTKNLKLRKTDEELRTEKLKFTRERVRKALIENNELKKLQHEFLLTKLIIYVLPVWLSRLFLIHFSFFFYFILSTFTLVTHRFFFFFAKIIVCIIKSSWSLQ